MSTTVTYNGTSFIVPAVGDAGWGANVSAYLIALATGSLTKAGGAFTLTSEVNFGATFGLKTPYVKGATANPAATGVLRLANADFIAWRNAANSADLALGVNASNQLTFGGTTVPSLALGTANQLLGVNAGATANEYKSLVAGATGTMIVSQTTGQIALDTIQGIRTVDSPTFFGLNLSGFNGVLSASSGALSAAATLLRTLGGTGISSTATFPSSGVIVTEAAVETLTNKTFTAPVQTNYEDFTELGSAPGNPSAGFLRFYAQTGDTLAYQNSSGTVTTIGTGSGQKNYLALSSSTAAGWTASGAGITVATDIIAADLPRPITTKTGIKFLGVSGSTAYAYARFTLDPADYGVKLQLQFAMNILAGYVASDFKVDVYSNTASNYSGTSTRLPLSTDASSITALPALEGTFRTTFDAPGAAAQYLEVRVGLNGTNTHSVVLSDIIVGPGTSVQGAMVGPWQSYTPTIGGFGSGAATVAGKYRRNGDSIDIRISLNTVTVAGTGTADLTFTIPSGLTIAASSLATGAVSGTVNQVGNAETFSISAASKYDALNSVYAPSTTTLAIARPTTANRIQGQDVSTTAELGIRVDGLSINEWAGSGVVNLAQNDVQYYFSTGNTWGTSNASATTSQGQGGVLGGTTTPAGANFAYTFTPTTPIPVGAKPVLEVSGDQVHWSPIGASLPGVSGVIENARFDGTNYIGASVSLNNSGQIVVLFGKYLQGTSTAWNGTWYWRVTVGLPGQAVGFGAVVPGQSAGLVPSTGIQLAVANAVTGVLPAANMTAAAQGAAGTIPSYVAASNPTQAVTVVTGGGTCTGTVGYGLVRVGNLVTVNGAFSTGTITGTVSQIYIPLPSAYATPTFAASVVAFALSGNSFLQVSQVAGNNNLFFATINASTFVSSQSIPFSISFYAT